MGASNELPESEELDALYDRFLIRRRVNQVRSYFSNVLLYTSLLDPQSSRDVNLGVPYIYHSIQEEEVYCDDLLTLNLTLFP